MFVCLLFYNGKSGSVIIRRHPPYVTLPLKRQHKKVIHILNRPCIVIIRLEQVNKITVIITVLDIVTVLITISAGLHKLWYPGIRDTSTWSKFGAHGEHGDVFLFSNLGAL